MLKYHHIGLTVKSDLPEKDATLSYVLNILSKLNAHIFVDPERTRGLSCAKGYPSFEGTKGIDLLLVIGGDGTILRAIRETPLLHVPILSINRGAVGFLAEMTLDEADDLLPKLLGKEGTVEERRILTIEAWNGKQKKLRGFVLNEAVIAQGAIARLLNLKTTVNGEALTTFHADGLIIATPTGSTAYSLAAGGPIVHPHLSAMILTPLNAHSFSQKPLVLPGTYIVEIEVVKKRNKFMDSEVSLTLDGQTYIPLNQGDRVRATMGKRAVKFLRRKQDSFFATLRTKLKWGERLER